jgi:hypothetical protein
MVLLSFRFSKCSTRNVPLLIQQADSRDFRLKYARKLISIEVLQGETVEK